MTGSGFPTITSVSPLKVPWDGGVEVTITGFNFTGATSVMFHDLPAQFEEDSDTQIRATAPDAHLHWSPSSQLNVIVIAPGGTSTPSADAVQFGDRSD